MPIKPENKSKYPANWKEISKRIRFDRAAGFCEVCGTRNYSVGCWDGDRWVGICGNIYYDCAGHGLQYPSLTPLTYKEARHFADELNEVWSIDQDDPMKQIVIVLTVAHLDHNPENCADDNLKAMCQRCHNNYDKGHRKETRTKQKGQLIIELA